MPTYKYRCANEGCTHEFEIFQRMSDDTIQRCPECKNMTLRRVVGAGQFILKGDGWASNEAKGKWHEK